MQKTARERYDEHTGKSPHEGCWRCHPLNLKVECPEGDRLWVAVQKEKKP